jgi:predicted PurR-regulated permease PerM
MSERSQAGALKSNKVTSVHGRPLPIDARARTMARAVLVIILVLLAAWVAFDFLSALGWAAVLAISLWPLHARFAALIPERRSPLIAPLVFTTVTGLVLFLPIALAVHQMARESEDIIRWVVELRETGIPVPGWLELLPTASEHAVQWWRTNLTDPQAASAWFPTAEGAAAWTKAFGGQIVFRTFMFFVALIALFVLLRNGDWIATRVLDTADRILGDPGERLASRMVQAIRGTVNGTVVIAIAEGLLIGIGYVAAGVPNPTVFTLLTIGFAMLPFGAWIAFTAAALLLVFKGGSEWAGAGVFAWGAAVMLVGDHFFWPTLVGRAARLPFLFALIGIFGGLQTFGLLGLFLGPVIMAALLTVWREWLVPRAINRT